MPRHPLFASTKGWDLRRLPEPIRSFQSRSNDASMFSEFHPSSRSTTESHAYITQAVIEYIKGAQSKIALIEVGEKTYATEFELESGETFLFALYSSGQCKGAIRTETGRYTPIKTIGSRSDDLDTTPIFMALLGRLAIESKEFAARLETAKQRGTLEEADVYYFSDAAHFALEGNHITVSMPGGNIDLLTAQTVESNALMGNILCGQPKILGSSNVLQGQNITFQAAMREFETWRKDKIWTDEEKLLIPTFPDDFPVMPEAMKICRRYVATHEDKVPMLNFMWRGVTSYGKSTGVAQIAAMLHLPLLKITCNSTMETRDFLSSIVPASNPQPRKLEDLPTFDEIAFDPESAYFSITGHEKDNVTSEECLKAYAEAFAAHSRENHHEGPLFKHVESNFVRALERGYLLEIQECSRIKDPGVLVGLNEFDHPGAIIPLVDGSYVRRSKDAVVIYTDNCGYASCRPVDPSVLRRMALIIDSNEIPEETAIARVIYNTGFQDMTLLKKMYNVWQEIRTFCADRDITEGSISLNELERWAQCVMADGYTNLKENCEDCVISKATSVKEDQDDIISSVLTVHLSD